MLAFGSNPRVMANLYTAYNEAGAHSAMAGNYGQALAQLDRALAAGRGGKDALYNRGQVYLKLRRFEEAERDMRAALKASPDFSKARSGLAG